MKASSWMLICTVLLATACNKSEKPSGETQAAATPAASPAGSATASDDGEGIATEEDFEDEAEQKITRQNADEELDKLEKEISN
jgi:hypothetical protein